MMGAPLGLLLSMVIGGVVAERYGWRGAFVAAGIPGLLLAALVRVLFPDPSRANHAVTLVPPPSFGVTVSELAQRRGFWPLIIGMSLAALRDLCPERLLGLVFSQFIQRIWPA